MSNKISGNRGYKKYKNSDEYNKIINMSRDVSDCNGTFVFGSDWFIPVYFNRLSKSVIDNARSGNVIRFKQNYLCNWIGVSDGGLINISKLMKARIVPLPELECPKDKRGNLEICEYVMGIDVARSALESNNKTCIVVLKIIRSNSGSIRQIQLVNIIVPPNGLNYEEQSIIVKRAFYNYGGNLDLTKSRVKAVVVDAVGLGQGLVEKLLEDVTDFETSKELGCWATINTSDKPKVKDAPLIVYALTAQGINADIIRIFIDSVESNKLKLVKPFDDIKEHIPDGVDKIEVELVCAQTQILIDEVANLKLKKLPSTITIEPLLKKIDKDRYSALSYGLYYIAMFMDKEEEENNDVSNYAQLSGYGRRKI